MTSGLWRTTQQIVLPRDEYKWTWEDVEPRYFELVDRLKGTCAEFCQVRIGDFSGRSADSPSFRLISVAQLEHLPELLSPALSKFHLAAKDRYKAQTISVAGKSVESIRSANRFEVLENEGATIEEAQEVANVDIAEEISPEQTLAAQNLIKHWRLRQIRRTRASHILTGEKDLARDYEKIVSATLNLPFSQRILYRGPVVHLLHAIKQLEEAHAIRKKASNLVMSTARGQEMEAGQAKVKALRLIYLTFPCC